MHQCSMFRTSTEGRIFNGIDWGAKSFASNGNWAGQQEFDSLYPKIKIKVTIPYSLDTSNQPPDLPVLVYLTDDCGPLLLGSEQQNGRAGFLSNGLCNGLTRFVTISIIYTSIAYKKMKKITPCGEEVFNALEEIMALFPNKARRFIMGYGHGAFSILNTCTAPAIVDFSLAHILFNPYIAKDDIEVADLLGAIGRTYETHNTFLMILGDDTVAQTAQIYDYFKANCGNPTIAQIIDKSNIDYCIVEYYMRDPGTLWEFMTKLDNALISNPTIPGYILDSEKK